MNIGSCDAVFGYAVLIIQVIAAVIAILTYSKYNKTPLRFFPIILIYTALNEIIGGLQIFASNNVLIYNIYNIISFLFFQYIFWHYVKKNRYRNWIIISMILYLLTCIINPFFQNFQFESQLLSYIVGACSLLFCIILYFIEILSTSQVLIINRELLFWISIGLLLFYSGYIPIKLTRIFFEHESNLYLTLRIVHRSLIVIMNACFVIGFLWMKKK